MVVADIYYLISRHVPTSKTCCRLVLIYNRTLTFLECPLGRDPCVRRSTLPRSCVTSRNWSNPSSPNSAIGQLGLTSPPLPSSVQYRVMLVVWQLGWVEIDLGYYTTCWTAGVMAEWAEQVGSLVELENLSQHNTARPPASPCITGSAISLKY